MNKYSRLMGISVLLLACTALSAQVFEKRATFTGKSEDGGRCSVEVVVDKAAEVMIFADHGVLRSIDGGEPAGWHRLECTSPMPVNMRDFRLEPREGRGRVNLVQDPRSNKGRALVHIDDPQPGVGTYAFNLIWRGGDNVGDWDRDRPFSVWERFRVDGWHRDGEQAPPLEARSADRDREGDRRPDAGRFEGGLDFRGPGSGNFTSRRGEQRLAGCEVKIREDGDVRINFRTRNDTEITLTGRIVRREGDRVVADVSGAAISGTAFLDIDHGRVRRVEMTGGRDRDHFDLNWRDEESRERR